MTLAYSHKRKGLGLIEVIIAAIIVVAAAIPLLRMLTSSRTETTGSVNYLRAMELANETLEWASIAKFAEVDKLVNLSGPIVVDSSSKAETIKVDTIEVEYERWKGSDIFNKDLQYSEDYTTAFFYREIEVEPMEGSYFSQNLLKKVTVTIKWCEGYRPKNLNLPGDRNRQVQLSLLVINDENLIN